MYCAKIPISVFKFCFSIQKRKQTFIFINSDSKDFVVQW